ncbi:MAG: D-alanine--D-alanine ligase, partial [Candidatus Limnocylindria bacterium]
MRLVLLFGGRSAEHDVSCVTGAHVLAAADATRYDIVPVGITPGGRWVLAEASDDRLTAEGPEVQPADVLAQPDTVAFPVLHGPFGEDVT